MNCSKCGAYNDPQAKFCPNCGNILTNENLNPTNEFNQNVGDLQNNNINNNSSPDPNLNTPSKPTNNKKKKLLILLGGLLVIGIGTFVGFKLWKNKEAGGNALFAEDALIKVEKDGKYGYINTDGKFIIEAIYEDAEDFQGNYAVVETTVKIDGVDKEIYQLIDKKGKVKMQVGLYDDIEYIPEDNVWIINEQLYNGSLKRISADNITVKYIDEGYLTWEDKSRQSAGIMNTSGKKTYTYKFQNNETYFSMTPSDIDETLSERYCIINIELKKYGIVNCDTGKIVYNYVNNQIFDEDDNIFGIYDNSYHLISMMYIQNNKIVYQTKNEKEKLDYDPLGYVLITNENSKKSYLDLKTNKILQTKPDNVGGTYLKDWEKLTGITTKDCSNGYGLVKDEKEILPCEWNIINYFGNDLYQYLKSKGKDYVLGIKNDKTYLIDLKTGKSVAEFADRYVLYNSYSTFVYYNVKSSHEKMIYNLLTEKTFKTNSDNLIDTYANYITIEENNKKNYYNTNFKLIYSEEL